MPIKSATRGTKLQFFAEPVDTGESIIIAIPNSFKHHTFYIQTYPAANITAGKIVIESTDLVASPTDFNDFGPITNEITLTTGITATMVIVTVEGVYLFIRIRVSENVVGGTFNVSYVGS